MLSTTLTSLLPRNTKKIINSIWMSQGLEVETDGLSPGVCVIFFNRSVTILHLAMATGFPHDDNT